MVPQPTTPSLIRCPPLSVLFGRSAQCRGGRLQTKRSRVLRPSTFLCRRSPAARGPISAFCAYVCARGAAEDFCPSAGTAKGLRGERDGDKDHRGKSQAAGDSAAGVDREAAGGHRPASVNVVRDLRSRGGCGTGSFPRQRFLQPGMCQGGGAARTLSRLKAYHSPALRIAAVLASGS